MTLETPSDRSSLSARPPSTNRFAKWTTSYPVLSTLLCILLVNGFVVLWLCLLGRPFVPAEEALRLWSTSFIASDNSQHLSDPFTALHVVFGMGLFLLIDRLKPHWPFNEKLIVAVAGSGVWEAVENVPAIIALFNDAGDPRAYPGDSIVNSLSDMAFVVLGCLFARALPLWVVLALALMIEIAMAVGIGDGLILGTLKLVGLYAL